MTQVKITHNELLQNNDGCRVVETDDDRYFKIIFYNVRGIDWTCHYFDTKPIKATAPDLVVYF